MNDFIDVSTYKFSFGQYYGFSYKEILRIDPHYVHWCHYTLPDFNLDDAAEKELAARMADLKDSVAP